MKIWSPVVARAVICLASISFLAITLGGNHASAQEWKLFGNTVLDYNVEWTSQDANGRRYYLAVNGHGDQFRLSCDPRSPSDGWIIDVSIGATPAPPDEPINLRVGKGLITMRASNDGKIYLASAADADPYYWLWTMIHQGRSLSVSFTDNRNAKFNLDGASTVLSDGVCPPRGR